MNPLDAAMVSFRTRLLAQEEPADERARQEAAAAYAALPAVEIRTQSFASTPFQPIAEPDEPPPQDDEASGLVIFSVGGFIYRLEGDLLNVDLYVGVSYGGVLVDWGDPAEVRRYTLIWNVAPLTFDGMSLGNYQGELGFAQASASGPDVNVLSYPFTVTVIRNDTGEQKTAQGVSVVNDLSP